MKKLVINKEHKMLIDSVVMENPKYRGNEELIDLFSEAVYKKSYLLMDAIRDKARLKRHIAMISDSCIDQILKEKKKFEDTKVARKTRNIDNMTSQIVNIKKTPLTPEVDLEDELKKHQEQKGIVNLKEEIQRSEKYDSTDLLIDPIEFCPKKRVSSASVNKLMQIVQSVSQKFPKKRYNEIFAYRYIKKLNQIEIARQMKISQVELSKRFVELVQLAKESI